MAEQQPEAQYDRPERRQEIWLSDRQIADIAERAKELAMQQVYAEIGKSTIKAALYLIGAAGTALGAWFHFSDKTPLK